MAIASMATAAVINVNMNQDTYVELNPKLGLSGVLLKALPMRSLYKFLKISISFSILTKFSKLQINYK